MDGLKLKGKRLVVLSSFNRESFILKLASKINEKVITENVLPLTLSLLSCRNNKFKVVSRRFVKSFDLYESLNYHSKAYKSFFNKLKNQGVIIDLRNREGILELIGKINPDLIITFDDEDISLEGYENLKLTSIDKESFNDALKLKKYFLNTKSIWVFGKPIKNYQNLIVGLFKDKEFRGLGIIIDKKKSYLIKTPVSLKVNKIVPSTNYFSSKQMLSR